MPMTPRPHGRGYHMSAPMGPDDNTSPRIWEPDSSAVEYVWEVDSEIYTIAFQQSLEICV